MFDIEDLVEKATENPEKLGKMARVTREMGLTDEELADIEELERLDAAAQSEGYNDAEIDEDLEDCELERLSKSELELIEYDYTVPYSEDPIKDVIFLYDRYFKIQGLDPEIEYEEQMKNYAQEVILAVLADYEIPTDDITQLFRFVLTVESVVSSHSTSDPIFGGKGSVYSSDALNMRISEFLDENPTLFCNLEVYDGIFDIEPELQKTKTYKKVLRMCYEDLIASGSVPSLEALLQLYNERKPLADEYLEIIELPKDNKEDFKKAFNLLVKNERQKSSVKKRFRELKETIQQQYNDDAELAQWAAAQQELETKAAARNYNLVKWGSLVLMLIIGTLVFPIIGTLLFAGIWAVIFFTKIHDAISFLREGKKAVDTLKNK